MSKKKAEAIAGTNAAAIYLRVSTDEQADRYGLAAQQRTCTEYAEANDLEIVRTCIDAITGQTTDRPGIQEIIAAAEQGTIQHVILLDHSRLGRNVGVSAILREVLMDLDIPIHYAAEGGVAHDPGGLLDVIQDAMSAEEVKIMQRRLQAGRFAAAEDNRVVIGGKIPFGFRRERHNPGTPDAYTELIIDVTEAAVVRDVYRRWLTDESTVQIADALNEQGIERASGAEWNRQNVGRLLKDEIYVGNYFYGRTRTIRGKRKDLDKSDWVLVEVPRIIDNDTYARAQIRLDANRDIWKGNDQYNYLFRGRVFCSECGGVYRARTQHKGRYMHYKHTPTTECDWKIAIGRGELEPVVMDALMRWINDPDKVTIDTKNEPDNLTAHQIEQSERRLKQLEDEWERAKNLAVQGSLTADELDEQRTRINAERVVIEEDLEALRDNQEPDYWSWVEPSTVREAMKLGMMEIRIDDWPGTVERSGVRIDIFPDPEGIGWEPRISVVDTGEREELISDNRQV